jgi:hypothetical protein
MIMSWPTALLAGLVLCLVQFLAAAPWLTVVTVGSLRPLVDRSVLRLLLPQALGAWAVASVLAGVGLHAVPDPDTLSLLGRFYGALLNLQLGLDFVILALGFLLLIWPRGGAVARAAFFEGVRQPMFWFLILVLGLPALLIMPLIPYFTFGEDFKMVKELGYDWIILLATLFAVLAASTSISEEIEGRTAVTLMSKPVSRRQFLLGKFAGILLAAFLMTGLLSMVFFLMLWFKPWYDREPVPPPALIADPSYYWPALGDAINAFWRGVLWWSADAVMLSSGLILGTCQVMVLLAIAVALATRLPMVVNILICLAVFFLGHLTPVLIQVTQTKFKLVQFVARLFDTLLPGLDFFNIGPALTRDVPPDPGRFAIYIGTVTLYALLYTTIALLLGLILFEDRDLA